MASIEIPRATAISDYAIIVDQNDNVAVVKTATFADLEVLLPNGEIVKLRGAIPPGHRFATCDIPAREFVRQFGQPIGTSLGILSGQQITSKTAFYIFKHSDPDKKKEDEEEPPPPEETVPTEPSPTVPEGEG